MILRNAKMKDAAILLKWRNDEQTRANSRNTEPVKESEHLEWLEYVLNNQSRKLYIAEVDGLPVGTIRVDDEGSFAELSWTIVPEHRGKGYAKQMVSLIAEKADKELMAVIKQSNAASIKVATNAGFDFYVKNGDFLVYRRTI